MDPLEQAIAALIQGQDDLVNAVQTMVANLAAPTPPNMGFGMLPAAYANMLKDYFVYSCETVVAAGSTAQNSVTIQADSDFVWTKGIVVCTNAAGTSFTDPLQIPVTVQLKDTSAGRFLSDELIPISSQFGTPQLPFEVLPPRPFRESGQLSVSFQNLDINNAYTVWLCFAGFKVFQTAAN